MASQEDNSFIVISDTANSGNFMATNASNTQKQFGQFVQREGSTSRHVEQSSSFIQQSSSTSSTMRTTGQSPVFQRPLFGMGRSGSLPPFATRMNYKSPVRNEFEQDMEPIENKESFASYAAAESQMAYYKGIESKARSQFKPVGSSGNEEESKRPRDPSNPTTIDSKRVRTPVSFLDHSTEDDSASGELSDIESRHRQKGQRVSSLF